MKMKPAVAALVTFVFVFGLSTVWMAPTVAEEPTEEVTHGSGPDGADGADEHGAAAHGADDGHGAHANTNPLSIDPDLAIFTFIIFALLAVILRKFAWGPIRDAVEQRERRIAEQLEEAQRNRDEAQRMLSDHEAKLAATADEVKTIMDEARRDAENQKGQIIADAETAAAEQKDRAVREIDAAKNSALEQLASRSVDQAVSLAGRIVGQSLNKDDHGKLIQDALKQFPSDN